MRIYIRQTLEIPLFVNVHEPSNPVRYATKVFYAHRDAKSILTKYTIYTIITP